MKEIYLDYAAATPVAEEVFAEMEPYFSDEFANAGAIHSPGQRAHATLDNSREIVAGELNCMFDEVIFTGSATEANNMLISGAIRRSKMKRPRVIISSIEHESISAPCDKFGAETHVDTVVVPVSEDGYIDVDKLSAALTKDTVVVSAIFASNVIGTIQPIEKIANAIKEFKYKNKSIYPIFHTDAAQAFQFMKLDVKKLGVNALTLSGQKIYGPKGVGILFLEKKYRNIIKPLIVGGLQEFGMRAGTENIPAIAGFARAVELISKERGLNSRRIQVLRDYFWEHLRKIYPNIELNGSMDNRLPNNLHIYFPGIDGHEMLIKLDKAGIAASIGSACSVRSIAPSFVVLALGFSEERAKSSIR